MLEIQVYSDKNSQVPIQEWEQLIGSKNIFLSCAFAKAVWEAPPSNLNLKLIGFFVKKKFVGGAMIQQLSFGTSKSFGLALKTSCNVYKWMVNFLGRRIYILGNSMVSGEHAFFFDEKSVEPSLINQFLSEALSLISNTTKQPCVVMLKDFEEKSFGHLDSTWKNFTPFEVQPSMVLSLKREWETRNDYLSALSTKYRTRANSAKEKLADVEKRELNLNDCIFYEKEISQLYQNVAENASYNLFELPQNHFTSLKKNLREKLRLFGYFHGNELIGFYTLILNGDELDTYFLGYHPAFQKEKKIYLNFLLDMVEWGIKHRSRSINFGRTALEIKSTIGAEPIPMKGLIQHRNVLINRYLRRYFTRIYQQEKWTQRRPFKKNLVQVPILEA